jgi:hypothetical protein
LEEKKENDDDDDDEDGSHSTDTSNLANIIVKHVLDTAVSSFIAIFIKNYFIATRIFFSR